MPDIREENKDIFYHVLESMQGIVVADIDGKIIFLNDRYSEILQVDKHEAIGKDIRDVIPGTRMHIVARTGCEEMGSLFMLKNGESVLVNRIPVQKNGKIIGVASFGSLSKADEMSTMATIQKISHLSQELNQYKSELNKLRGAKYSLDQIIGNSPNLIKMKELIKKVAQTKSTVLITGETGTGKELVAHAIHQLSTRSHHSFVRLNCAAIPNDLLESELFGYEEGAFTGAKKGGKVGKFELAHGGSLLLDEINQMPQYLQSKLLRVIQEKEVERVGGSKPFDIDVRLIFTTNQNLQDLVHQDNFREDLYYRINVMNIEIPPLRERLDDIPLLVEHFIFKINKDLGLNITGIDDKVIKLFQDYHWPGNIRELENTIERAANLALQGTIKLELFEHFLLRAEKERSRNRHEVCLETARVNAEKETIIRVLDQTNSISMAAKLLRINRSVLYEKLKKYDIKIK
ncbi:sigma-54 interaction domain-containing protein [Desulfosporosinus nitroreducens]|uniref:Sigma 54-interacting transcriptional regulator n=3 Tax=Desulfosporosinus nitroreducens TaxID=2018668 RepID=A0ABT8QMQ2_9FIRM|nr:sigma 54-interacting transcriptional regulator [Desulfosporosinus nitroreducens]MDO0822581.1 sigma 54-interacting transcriptional regulator [Desulfosporosinus nitroreducens]